MNSELTYEETLKLENGKEHLQVVLNNLRIVEGELSAQLLKLEDTHKAVAEAGAERDKLLTTSGEVLETIGRKLDSISTQTKALDERDADITTREKSMAEKEQTAINSLVAVNLKTQMMWQSFEEKNENLSAFISDREIYLSQLTNKINEQDATYEQKLRLSTSQENELNRINQELEDSKRNLEAFQAEAESKVAEANRLIEEEKEKVKSPLQALEIATSIYNRKVKDLGIIRLRLKKQYDALNPDGVAPIELRDN